MKVRFACTLFALGFALARSADAQIVTDGSTGAAETLIGLETPLGETEFQIPASLGTRKGSALFHSFSSFGLGSNEIATFTPEGAPQSINNVLARVTGGEPSQIDGTIRSTIPGANLFFMNPSGVFFSGASSIEVGGSFFATTADEILLGPNGVGGVFSTRDLSTERLNPALPWGFRFLDAPIGKIRADGRLEVPTGERIGLIGGDITISGNGLGFVSAPEGEVVLVSVGSAGTVTGVVEARPRIDVTGFSGLGDIRVIDEAIVSAAGISPSTKLQGLTDAEIEERWGDASVNPAANAVFLGTLPSGNPLYFNAAPRPEGSGDIYVVGRNLRVVDSDLRTITLGDGDAGKIDLRLAGDLLLEREDSEFNTGLLARAGGVSISGTVEQNTVEAGIVEFELDAILPSDGRGGDIFVEAENVEILGGAVAASGAGGAGEGGDVSIIARGDIRIAGSAENGAPISDIFGKTQREGRQISAVFSNAQGEGASGHGGDIYIKASGDLLLEEGGAVIAQTQGDANAGNVTVDVETLRIFDDSQIDNSTSAQLLGEGDPGTKRGQGGSVDVSSSESVLLSGRVDDRNFARISTFSQEKSTGNAGTIKLNSPDIRIENGGGIAVTSRGAGDAGGITVETLRLEMSAGEISAQSTGEGVGASGIAGTITIGGLESGENAESVKLFNGSNITVAAPRAMGGSVVISADEIVSLVDSVITASVVDGNGGNIIIDPRFVVLDSSQIIARSGTQNGGRIDITAQHYFESGGSVVSASSESGVDGEVFIRSPDTDLNSELASLPTSLIDATALLDDRCAVVDGASGSSLVVEAHDGAPVTPLQVLTGVYQIAEPTDEAASRARVAVQTAQQLEGRGLYGAALRALEDSVAWADREGGPEDLGSLLALRARLQQRAGNSTARSMDLGRLAELSAGYSADLAANILLDRAASLRWSGHSAEARATYEEIIAGETAAVRERAQLELAALDLETGDRAGAARRLESLRVWLAKTPAGRAELDARLRAAALLERVGAAAGAVSLYTGLATFAEAGRFDAAAGWAWGRLARQFEAQNRLDDALKLTRRAIVASEEAQRPESLYRWQWQAGRLLERQGESVGALAAYRRAADGLFKVRATALARAVDPVAVEAEFSANELIADFLGLLLSRAEAAADAAERQRLLGEALERVEDAYAGDLQDYFHDACIAAQRRERPEAIPGALVIYPIVLRDRVVLVSGSEAGLDSVSVPVTAERLESTVRELRTYLQQRTTRRYQRPAADLFDWLVRPLEDRIAKTDPDALVFVPRGILLGVPLAALFDREREEYLIQQHPVAVVPGLSLTDPRHLEVAGTRVLAAGLTDSVQGYPALPHVGAEIDAVGALFDGEQLLNQKFDAAALADRLGGEAFGIVHVASHAEFGDRGDEAFVLTYDDRLPIDELGTLVRSTRLRDNPIELLALSACKTALGSDRSPLGLAGISVKSGARSTLATLWFVNDRASSALIDGFYKHLAAPGVSRAEALQRAQLALIGQRELRHPAYWSSFLLLGSWL